MPWTFPCRLKDALHLLHGYVQALDALADEPIEPLSSLTPQCGNMEKVHAH
jgi:hypothetical protein